jgi:hypothetical protein
MEYKSLTTDEQDGMLRNHLKQAEADHFLHTLQVEEAQLELDTIPSEEIEVRATVEAHIAQLEKYRDTAGSKAEMIFSKMEGLSIPVEVPVDIIPEKEDGGKLEAEVVDA